MRAVHRHAQGQVVLLTGSSPLAYDVALGSQVHRVPLLVGRVPQVEVVVVLTQRKEITGTHALVQGHQLFRIPLLSLPVAYQLLQTIFAGIAEMLYVPVVLTRTLIVHETGIPVAILSLTLRSPMGPDAKLRILEPLRTLPGCQTLPRSIVGTLLDGYVGLGLLCRCRQHGHYCYDDSCRESLHH